MGSLRKSVGLFALLVGIFAYSSPAPGQSSTQVRGTVADYPGGHISNAIVTLFSDDRVRTAKTDDQGRFVFSGLSSPTRFLEASAKGFAPVSVPIDSTTPDELSFTLQPWSCSNGCGLLADARIRSVQYQDRSSQEQLSGTVGEYMGSPLVNVWVVLKKADLNDPWVRASFAASRNTSMGQRGWRYSFVARMASDNEGNFHFAGLEPGWYSLEVNHGDYSREIRSFWIARDTLTRPSPIELVHPGGPSPVRSFEANPVSQ